jgi:hypothetical protein
VATWVQLADEGWINMANVNAVRRERNGHLRLEFIGERGTFVEKYRRISDARDVAVIEDYLTRATARSASLEITQPMVRTR